MSREIDNKVVSMEFDNSNFERNVSTSLSTIEKLKQALNFKGAERGFDDISSAARKLPNAFDGIGNAIDSVEVKFSALQVAGITALQNLTNKAIDTGIRFAKALSVDQMSAGWTKYGQKTEAIQTIMAATGDSIEYVEQQMEKLNWYTDETSYDFTDMANNIGKFTSAGVDLETATSSMMGIANWAAVSGQQASGAARAMYNISQAMGMGHMGLADWRSIELANMATMEFKQTVLDTAVEMGKLVELDGEYFDASMDLASLSGDITGITPETFRESLKSGWFDKDLMTEVFTKYSEYSDAIYDISDAYDTASEAMAVFDEAGYNEGMELAEKAFRAAQEAKTFADAVNAVKDATSTAFMNVFETIFGNYEEAKVLWTDLANGLWDTFAGPVVKLNGILKRAFDDPVKSFNKELEKAGVTAEDFENALSDAAKKSGIDLNKLIDKYGSLDNALRSGELSAETAAGSGKTLISEALRLVADGKKAIDGSAESLKDYQAVVEDVIKGTYGNGAARVKALTDAGYDYNTVQNLINVAWDGSKLNLEKLTDAMSDFSDEELEAKGYTEEEIKAMHELAEAAETSGTRLNELINSFEKPSGRELLAGSIMNAVTALNTVLGVVDEAFSNVFDGKSISDGIYSALEALNRFTEGLILSDGAASSIQNVLETILRVVKIIGQVISIPLKFLGVAYNVIKLMATAAGSIFSILNGGKTTSAFDSISNILDTISNALSRFTNWIDSVSDTLAYITDLLSFSSDTGLSGFLFGKSSGKLKLAMLNTTLHDLSKYAQTKFPNAAGFISGVENSVMSLLSKGVVPLANKAREVRDMFGKISKEISSKLGDDAGVFETLRTVFDVSMTHIKDQLSKFGNEIWDKITIGFPKVHEKITQLATDMPHLFGWLQEPADHIQNIIDTLNQMFTLANKQFGDVSKFQVFSVFLKLVGEGIRKNLMSRLEELAQKYPLIFGPVLTFVNKVREGIASATDFIVKQINKVKNTIGLIKHMFAVNKEAAESMNFNPVVKTLQDVAGILGGNINQSLGKLKDNLTPLYDRLKGGADSALTKFSQYQQLISDVLKMQTSFKDAAGNITFDSITKAAANLNKVTDDIGDFNARLSMLRNVYKIVNSYPVKVVTALGRAGTAVKTFVGEMANAIKDGYDEFISGAKFSDVFKTVSDRIKKAAKPAKEAIEDAYDIISKPIKKVFDRIGDNIGDAFRNARNRLRRVEIGDVFEAIGNWFERVIDSVRNFFEDTNIGGIISEIFRLIGDAFKYLWDHITGADYEGIFDRMTNAIGNAFRNLWDDIRDVDYEGIFHNIADTLGNAFERFGDWLQDIDLEDALTAIGNAIEWVFNHLRDLVGQIDFEGLFDNARTALDNAFDDLRDFMQDRVGGFLEDIDWEQVGNSAANVAGRIILAIRDAIDRVREFISNLSFDDIKARVTDATGEDSLLGKIFSRFAEGFSENENMQEALVWLQDIGESINHFIDRFREIWADIQSAPAFQSIIAWLKEAFSWLGDKLTAAFENIKNSDPTKFIEQAKTNLINNWNRVKDFFTGVKEKIEGVFEFLHGKFDLNALQKLSIPVILAIGGVVALIIAIVKTVNNVTTGFKSLGKAAKQLTNKKKTSFLEDLAGLFKSIAMLAGIILAMGLLFDKDKLKNVGWGVGALIGVLVVIGAFLAYMKWMIGSSKDGEKAIDKFSDVTSGLIKMVISLWFLSGTIKKITSTELFGDNPEEILKGIGRLIVIVGMYAALLWMTQKWGIDKKQKNPLGGMIGFFLAFATAMKIIDSVDPWQMIAGVSAMLICVIVFSNIFKQFGKADISASSLAGPMSAFKTMSKLMLYMSVAFAIIGTLPLKKTFAIAVVLGALVFLLFKIIEKISLIYVDDSTVDTIKKLALLMVAIGATFALMGGIKYGKLAVSALAIIAVLAAITVMLHFLDKFKITQGTVTAVLTMAIVIAAIGIVLRLMAKLKPEQALASAGAITIVMVGIAAVLFAISKMTSVSGKAIGAIGAVAGVIVAIGLVMLGLAQVANMVDDDGVKRIRDMMITLGVAIAAFVLAAGLLAGFTGGAGVAALGVVAVALLAIAAAVYIFAAAMDKFATASLKFQASMTAMSTMSGPQMMQLSTNLKEVGGSATEGLITGFAKGMIKFTGLIVQYGPQIAAAFTNLVVGTIVSIAVAIAQNAATLVNSLLAVVEQLLMGLRTYIPRFIELVLQTIVSVIYVLAASADSIANALVTLVVYTINAMANAIYNNTDKIMAAIKNVLAAIINFILSEIQALLDMTPLGKVLSPYIDKAKDYVDKNIHTDMEPLDLGKLITFNDKSQAAKASDDVASVMNEKFAEKKGSVDTSQLVEDSKDTLAEKAESDASTYSNTLETAMAEEGQVFDINSLLGDQELDLGGMDMSSMLGGELDINSLFGGQDITSTFSSIGSTGATGFLSGFGNILGGSEGGLLSNITSGLNDEEATATFTSIGGDVAGGFKMGLDRGSSDAETSSTNLGTSVINAMRTVLQSHSPSEVFKSIGGDVGQGFVNGLNEYSVEGGVVYQAGSNLGNAVVNGVNSVFATGSMSSIVDTIASSISTSPGLNASLSAAGRSIASGLGQGISNNKSQVKASGSQLVAAAANSVRNSKGAMTTAGKTLADAMASGMRSKKSEVQTAGSELAKSGASGANTISQSRSNGSPYIAGRNFTQGFINGIKSLIGTTADQPSSADGATTVAGAAYAAGRQGVTSLAEAINQGSPSRITYQSGIYFGQGFVNGISTYSGVVGETAYDMGSTAVTNLSDALSTITDEAYGMAEYQPTIRPVLDLSEVRNGAGQISTLLGQRQASMVGAEVNAMVSGRQAQATERSSQLSALAERVNALSNSEAESYLATIAANSKKDIYLDNRVLVGELSPGVDTTLGNARFMASRHMI